MIDISANLFGFVNEKNAYYRNYETAAALGDKAQGKSTFVRLYAKLYHEIQSVKLQKGILRHPKKVLIVDPTDNDAFDEFEDISLEQLMYGYPKKGTSNRDYWLKGIRRIRKTRAIKDEVFINAITDTYRNGLLVVDEASEVIHPERPPKWQKELMKKHRMFCLDLFYVFHNFMDIPLKLRPHIWLWVLFRTPEKPKSVNYFHSRMFPNPEALWEKWCKVENSEHDDGKIIQHYEVHKKSFESVFKLREAKENKK